MKFIKLFLLTLFLYHITADGAIAQVKFGTLSTIDTSLLKEKMKPMINYLSHELDDTVVLTIGRNYKDTMDKLSDKRIDIGFIGPAPYVKIKSEVELVATLVSDWKPFFNSVIIVRKNSTITQIEDLKNKTFAFGSPQSTLSFYVPAYILYKSGILQRLKDYIFLNRHDRVAKHVIIGRYDAGGIKESVYRKYKDHLKILQKSDPYYDFVVVVKKGFDKKQKEKLKTALMKLKDKHILTALKPGATGFIEGKESNYLPVSRIVKEIDGLFLNK